MWHMCIMAVIELSTWNLKTLVLENKTIKLRCSNKLRTSSANSRRLSLCVLTMLLPTTLWSILPFLGDQEKNLTVNCSLNFTWDSSLNYCNYRHSSTPPSPQKNNIKYAKMRTTKEQVAWRCIQQAPFSKLVRYTTRRLKIVTISLKGEHRNGIRKKLITAKYQTLNSSPLTNIFPSIQLQKLHCPLTYVCPWYECLQLVRTSCFTAIAGNNKESQFHSNQTPHTPRSQERQEGQHVRSYSYPKQQVQITL
jgi:hypothetical protein